MRNGTMMRLRDEVRVIALNIEVAEDAPLWVAVMRVVHWKKRLALHHIFKNKAMM